MFNILVLNNLYSNPQLITSRDSKRYDIIFASGTRLLAPDTRLLASDTRFWRNIALRTGLLPVSFYKNILGDSYEKIT